MPSFPKSTSESVVWNLGQTLNGIHKTITMKTETQIQKVVFRILVIENDSRFQETLQAVLDNCGMLFPHLDFELYGIRSDNHWVGNYLFNRYDLVFIEDKALTEIAEPGLISEFILLLNTFFFWSHAQQIKQIIHENSLNLYEHISLTNYSFNLVKLLVIDFIKEKSNAE